MTLIFNSNGGHQISDCQALCFVLKWHVETRLGVWRKRADKIEDVIGSKNRLQ